jgi:hypothetical protein
MLLSTFTVLNTYDSGAGSFRDAITRVNQDNNQHTDRIRFAIGSGVQTIVLQSELPIITHPVVIDGTTEPGFAGTPLIELDGESAGASANGLTVAAGHSTVEGLVINRFGGDGILLEFNGIDTVAGNFIGTDVTGTTVVSVGGFPFLGNFNGVEIVNGSSSTIGGTSGEARNLISGNLNDGVLVTSGTGNRVQGNYIGTDVSGTLGVDAVGFFLGNASNGVEIDSSSNIVGGATPGARNVISGNGEGIYLWTGGDSSLVQGDYIGTDVTGTQAIPNVEGVFVASSNNIIGGTTPGARNVISGNSDDGIYVGGTGNQVQGNYIGTDARGSHALPNIVGMAINSSQNSIGGTAPGAGNVISGNRNSGLYLGGQGTLVQGNYIGTDAGGTASLGNGIGPLGVGLGGVVVQGSNNTIGGTAAAARNLISGNNGDGLDLIDGHSGNVVQGNDIGTDRTGRKALGNLGDGVGISINAPSNNLIGGTQEGAGNTIAFNGGAGVSIYPAAFLHETSSGTGDAILGNSIFSNQGLGISLGPGANNNQASPVLTSAASSGNATTIQGTLTSTPNTTFTLEFFSNPAGTSQGQTFLGSVTVTTDATGLASFTATFDVHVRKGKVITATATDLFGDTSEFSSGVAVT